MINRTGVPVLYMGEVFPDGPPWHYAAVMTALTTPVGILMAAFGGIVGWIRQKAEAPYFIFLVWNIVFWLVLFAFAGKPYDGVRLFLCIFPFIAMLAAAGLSWAWRRLSAAGMPPWVLGAGLFLFIASQGAGLFLYGPLGLSYYNALAGGLPGAVRKGFDVTFWGEGSGPEITDYLNRTAPDGARVAAFPMGALYVNNIRAFALLRMDLAPVNEWDDWDYLVLANRGAYLGGREDLKVLTSGAVAVKTVRGVPVVWLVERKH